MTVKQISVFIENISGRLAEVTRLLSDAEINLRALTIADTADFGILRIIVDDPEKAVRLLESNTFTAKITEVIGVEVKDDPGALAEVLELFEKNDVNIEYLYVTLERKEDGAVVIFKVEDLDRGLDIVNKNGLKTVSSF
ncbi:MAG: ACT domain-containing protein [Spirochaetia bacterium]